MRRSGVSDFTDDRSSGSEAGHSDTQGSSLKSNTSRAKGRDEAAETLRNRARRRVIGAAALLLAAAIIVPMLLDPEPRRPTDDIVIDIPSEKSPFNPRLALPPVPAADNAPVAPPPDIPEKIEETPTKTSPSRADEQRAMAALEGKTDAKSGKGKFVVQAAAPASEVAARNLAEKLKKAGLASYTEKVDTKQGARYRVRLGPYASREEADDVRTRLKAHGISANLVTL